MDKMDILISQSCFWQLISLESVEVIITTQRKTNRGYIRMDTEKKPVTIGETESRINGNGVSGETGMKNI